jgi:hypothetical protein
MKMTIAEFIQTLLAHRLFDLNLPSLRLEQMYWQQWCFDDTGAHYIPPIERPSLIIERAEEQFYETGKWSLQ